MPSDGTVSASPSKIAYIGCWYKYDMYSHNCSNLVSSLRDHGVHVEVVTSNCRCFSSAQRFSIAADELINIDCRQVAIPHAPRTPGRKHGLLKYYAVRLLRLDLWLAVARGFLYYRRGRKADVIHYDQVLEAFGCVPLFVILAIAGITGKKIVVTVHEIDPFQQKHRSFNKLYRKCAAIFAYSLDMKSRIADLGVESSKISVIKYGVRIPQLLEQSRSRYIFFGGHHITKGKGYQELLEALEILKSRKLAIRLLIYVGRGCNGLEEAKQLAVARGVADMIEWEEFFSGGELARAYQSSKACIVPYTGGSARHPLSCAMANGVPVIATRAVDIPEYLGELGIYVEGSGLSIAEAICRMDSDPKAGDELGKKLRAKASSELDIGKVAQEVGGFYSRICSAAGA